MTQARLLDIAVREFGFKGLEGASTRGIASAAGTSMSAITYHYGSKSGLYLAAADHIASRLACEMAPAMLAEEAVTADDTAGARAAIHRIIASFADKMAGTIGAELALFIMREQAHPTEAFDRIYSGLMGQMLERLVGLVATAAGVSDRRSAAIAAITLVCQVTGLRASRASILRLLGCDTLDPAAIADLKDRLHKNTDAIIDAMAAERQGQ